MVSWWESGVQAAVMHKLMNYLRFLALALAILPTACGPKSAAPSQANGTDSAATQSQTDPLAQLRALAARLDKPVKQLRFSQVKAEIRKTDAPVSPLAGTISANKLILYTDDDPNRCYKAEDIAYLEEFTIFADYLDGKWVYAGCKGRFRKPTETDWQDYEGDRKELRMHCSDELEAMHMEHDADAY